MTAIEGGETYRPFQLRFRPDLAIYPHSSGSGRSWIVKDPVSLRYFRFCEEEYAILRLLDGRRNLEEIREKFEQACAPLRMTTARLLGFLANLHRNGLLLSDGPGQGAELLERDLRDRSQRRLSGWSNILAIRIPGVDPESFLQWLYPKLRWCFTSWFLSGCLVLAAAALTLVLVHADQLQARLPEFRVYFTADNLFLLIICLAVTKVLHELGHALTCRHFGGECHEMGLMLLVFTPCLYCDVSDSWILRSRWQRVAISLAGILVEIVLASIATFGWWYSRPGLLNSVCLNLMVVCSVGTLLINGNPLLRYDGYFILSDLIQTPNLWQQSRAVVHRVLLRLALGIEPSGSVAPVERPVLVALYGIASMVYRAVVVIAILWFLYGMLQPLGLQLLAYLLALSIPLGMVVAGARASQRALSNPLLPRQLKPLRMIISASVIMTVGAGFFLVRLPCRVGAPAMLELDGEQRVYVAATGTLIEAVPAGDPVVAGQVVARLEDAEHERELLQVKGELAMADVRVQNLKARLAEDPQAEEELVVAQQMRADAARRVEERQAEAESFTLLAPIAGTVIAPPAVRPQVLSQQHLPRWTDVPANERNTGCTLERGTLLCLIGDPNRHEAVLFVDEWDLEYVRPGQRVRLDFDVAPGVLLWGTVREIARRELEVVPRELAAGRQIAHEPDPAGTSRPLEASYQVRVSLEDSPVKLIEGASGQAKIEVRPQTLARRLYRILRRTFARKS